MENRVEVGKIVNTHALKGEMRFELWDEDILSLKKPTVYINNEKYVLTSVKPHKNMYLIRIEGINIIEDAEKLKNKIVEMEVSDLPELDDNTYYIKDLIGLDIFENNKQIGKLTDCFQTGSNDVYVIKTLDNKEFLLPAIKDTILNVDLENNRMDIHILEGLLDDED